MSGVLPLLIEISALAARCDGAWVPRIHVGVAQLTRLMLVRDGPMESLAVHDSRREDCVAVCLAMAGAAAGASVRVTSTEQMLRQRLHALTLRCIGLALKAKREAAISSARREIAYTNHRI